MKKSSIVAWFVFSAFLIAAPFFLQGMALPDEAIELKEIEPFVYCCLAHKGPYTDIETVIGRLMEAMQNQGIPPMGPMVGVYYNSPAMVKPEELQWEIGFPVTEQASPQAPLDKKEWNFKQVVAGLHIGPYEKTGETIVKMIEWMTAQGLMPVGPILEKYGDADPATVKPEELKTEVWIPCRKKA
jgi:effector-binding domain-containing protein